MLRNLLDRLLLPVLLVLLWAQAAADGAVEGWRAGAARVEITPHPTMSNWVTHKPYGKVLEPVFVRAVVLEQKSNQIACVSWDLLYALEGAVGKVRQRINRETGIPESSILVCATHNHSAPWAVMPEDSLTKTERQTLDSFLKDPLYPQWIEQLMESSAKAVRQAQAARRPATLAIGRVFAGDLIFNRRPRKPDGAVQSLSTPADPYVLPAGLRFGPVDPTLTILALRDEKRLTIATLFHLPCHAVMIYPSYNGVSGDWPGAAALALRKELGGEALFLQGCAGDIVPARRGRRAREQMVKVITQRAVAAAKSAQVLSLTNNFRVGREFVAAPVTETVRRDTGREQFKAEVQVITCGPLALVALPGEPLIGLALAIQERSPFPHTVVIGYANGYGVQYVGLPGEKGRGGYESGPRNLGKDECGQLMVDAAVRLLEEQKRGE